MAMDCRIKTFFVCACLFCIIGCASKTPFKAFIDPLDSTTSSSESNAAPPDMHVAKPSSDDPVTLGMACTAKQTATGALIDVWIQVNLAEDVFLHAFDPQQPDYKHLEAELALPPGWQPQGDWESSATTLEAEHSVFRNRVQMHRQLLVPSPQTELPSSIAASVNYQACTDTMCWAPQRAELIASIPALIK